ncbi:hypothetical protein PHLGIDRAFT_124074 [Phlebiopsis gigantea 11061_1 CR5-6]|uniref:DUF6534 domain-containing protein n=1 Tax=Phlebiopsis gigantea (strain 11061_1 CR5-6) TaxID=745531 RepID=A0A0C3P3N4_PHLG1|nr:hypothetical protein PHLGIDRAFT_124074 [Phlebiopsis gigantea 11061_1 CR5-6]
MSEYSSTLGALLIGALLAVFLSGIVTMQVLVYYGLYPNDRAMIKSIVSVIWFLDLLHTAMICSANWMYLITHFGGDLSSQKILWPISYDESNMPPASKVTIALTAIVTFLVHCFFTSRVYSISKQKWFVAAPLGLLAFLRVVSAMTCTAQMVHAKTWVTFRQKSAWLFTTGLTISAVLDFFIALALIMYLQKSRTGWKAMDQLIDTIILYTIESGLLTSVVAILSLICWVTMSNNLIFLALHFTISKLYANSFLATLNARKTLQQRSHKSSTGDNQLPVMFPSNILGRSRFISVGDSNAIASAGVQITVEKTVQCVTESHGSGETPMRVSRGTDIERDLRLDSSTKFR